MVNADMTRFGEWRQIRPVCPGLDFGRNRLLLENYYLPGDLENQIGAFIEHYNYQRYHESLNNVTPADAHFGRAEAIIQQRDRINRQIIQRRRLQHRKIAA